MAAPTEQEFIALKETVQQLQAEKWLRDLALVIVGALAGAIPTITVAFISNRWSKKLFDLTRDKEESVIKSKLYGEIRMTEGKLNVSVYRFITSLIMWQYYLFREKAAAPDKKEEEVKEVQKYHREQEDNSKIYTEDKLKFVQLVSEYNYFAKDNNLEELLTALEVQTVIVNPELEKVDTKQLFGFPGLTVALGAVNKSNNIYREKIKAIVEHIRLNK